jgi:hypothetical protein
MQRTISPVHAEHTASNNTLLEKSINSSLKMVIYSFEFYYRRFIFPSIKHVQTLVYRSAVTTCRKNNVIITDTCWQNDIPNIEKMQALYTSYNIEIFSIRYVMINDMICLLTAIGLSPGGSSTIHIYTQTIRRTTQITTEQHK